MTSTMRRGSSGSTRYACARWRSARPEKRSRDNLVAERLATLATQDHFCNKVLRGPAKTNNVIDARTNKGKPNLNASASNWARPQTKYEIALRSKLTYLCAF